MHVMNRREALSTSLATALATASAISLGTSPAAAADPEYIEMSIGNPDASVTVVEYLSFTCSHCANFHTGPFKRIKANYIDPGRIKFVFREVYFDRPGLWAGMLARCGGAERYFGIADMLLGRQASWAGMQTGAAIAERLVGIGLAGGLARAEIDACFQDEEKARLLVETSVEQREGDGINATPSFIINGKPFPNMPYDEFAATIDGLLAG